MLLHNLITTKIVNFLECVYYNNLEKLNNIKITELFHISKYPILKPDYFIYLQYYFIYKFLHYITLKNIFKYSISLHLFHVNGLIYDNLIIKYDYTPINNILYLKNTSYLLFIYLFLFKISFLNIWIYKKIFLISNFLTFYSLMQINTLYKERLNSIELKTEFKHPLKILMITPNKNTIQNIIKYTNIFTYSNFLLLINIYMYIFL